MKSAVLNGNDLVIDEVQNAQALDLLEKTKDCRNILFSVSLENGEVLELPVQLSRVLEAVIETAAQGGRTSFSSVPSELTPAAAARLLGVSRPTLMKIIADGKIPSHKVGTHTRINTDDLLAYKAIREVSRSRAVEEMRELSDLIGDF